MVAQLLDRKVPTVGQGAREGDPVLDQRLDVGEDEGGEIHADNLGIAGAASHVPSANVPLRRRLARDIARAARACLHSTFLVRNLSHPVRMQQEEPDQFS
jgi:hypothetical protein